MEGVAPGNPYLGVMIPYAPLLQLIATAMNKPLVATSGNLSGSPIVFRDEVAIERLTLFADLVLTHDREIVVPQDDSVIRLTDHFEQPILLRRSRGYAPSLEIPAFQEQHEAVLAMGGELKSAFSLFGNHVLYHSQFLGELGSYDTQESFEHTLNHLLELTKVSPEAILVDAHPEYFATQLGNKISQPKGIFQFIQFNITKRILQPFWRSMIY